MISLSGEKLLSQDKKVYSTILSFIFFREVKIKMNGPLIAKIVFSHEAIDVCEPKNSNEFKVNGQHLKLFLESVPENEKVMGLFDPMYR